MDKVGEYTLEVMKLAGWYNNWLFSFVSPHLGKRTLEIGSGIGNFTELLVEKSEVYATDIDKGYLEGLGNKNKKVKVGYGDIEKGKFFFKGDVKFNSIVCMNVLEHIKSDRKALRNMKNLLVKDGKLVLLVPAHQIAYGLLDKNLGHYRRYSKTDLEEKITKAGFVVEKFHFLNMVGLIGWFVNTRILSTKVLPANQLSFFDLLVRPFLLLEKYIKPPFGLSLFVIARKI